MARRVAKEPFKTNGGIVGAVYVVKERSGTDSRVVDAGGIAFERIRTVGRIVDGGGVVKKGGKTGSCVEASSRVRKKRLKPIGRVVGATAKAVEGISPLSRVLVGITSVRCGRDCSRLRRESKKWKREHEGNKSFVQQTISRWRIEGKKAQDSRMHREYVRIHSRKFYLLTAA
jgi:hypothetical protein